MAQDNEGREEPKVRVSKAQKTLIFQEVMEELNRREVEMHKDTYASRDYCDGVRFEVGRLQEWLKEMMEK